MIYRPERGKKGMWQCAALCALSAFVSIVPFLFRYGGVLLIWSDFNLQQSPFGMALHNSLASLNPGGWTWSYALGMSTIQAFSFYAMGSPFYWLSLLFPVTWYPYLVGWIFILKYTVAGMAAYCFIRRFTKSDTAAILGALMYAFSAYQTTNLMYYHFHDVVALFPLILTGIEKVLEDPKDRGCLVFAVFINALNNYYFFVMEAVFAALYFLFRCFDGGKPEFRRLGKDVLNCILCGLWGMAMAAVLLVPSLMYVMRSSRAGVSVSRSDLFWSFRWLFFTLRGILLPGDTMAWQSAFYEDVYDSVAAWIPMAGMGFALAYCLKNRRKKSTWLSRMIPVLLLLSLSPLLASVFDLFREVTWRWWYMWTLLLALASAKVMEDAAEYPVKKSLLFSAGAVAALCAGVFIAHAFSPEDPDIVRFPGRFLAYGGIALGGILCALGLYRFGKLNSRLSVILLCLFCAGTTALTLGAYRSFWDFSQDKAYIERGARLETHDPQYRYGVGENQIMLPGGGSGLGIFSSTQPLGEKEFDLLFDFVSKNQTMSKALVPGLRELFAGKYRFSSDPGDQTPLQSMVENGEVLHVLTQEACPIGFAMDHYILRDQLIEIDRDHRGIALLYAAVIDPEDEAALIGVCTPLSAEEIPLEEDLSAVVAKNTENRVMNFDRDSRGFRCTSDYDRPRAVWFSVPGEEGWTAKIDGKKQEIISSGGMMLLIVPEGHHEIEFTYVTPGYEIGLYISLAAIAAFILSSVFRIRTDRRRRVAGSPR